MNLPKCCERIRECVFEDLFGCSLHPQSDTLLGMGKIRQVKHTRVQGGCDNSFITITPCELASENDVSLTKQDKACNGENTKFERTNLDCPYLWSPLNFFLAGVSMRVSNLISFDWTIDAVKVTRAFLSGDDCAPASRAGNRSLVK